MSDRVVGDVVVTKLVPPSVPAGLVRRPSLLGRIAGEGCRLTVVVAPAGWGKSTLLAEWCAAQSGNRVVAFAGLDRLDGDPVRFWNTVVAALATTGLEVGAGVPLSPQAAVSGLWEAVVPALVNELAERDTDVVLVIDDYHLVGDDGVHGGMRFLIDHLPRTLHLVVSTRREPPLGLARLRATGCLEEIRIADLALETTETAGLVRVVSGVELDGADVALLQAKTEGWPAGVQLAALSLRHHPDPGGFIQRFAGDHRHVFDYLTAEVLARLPAELRWFLLRCSILDWLEVGVCDAVVGSDNAAGLLREIEALNLFVVPLDETRGRFRLHRLFADWLGHQLGVEAPDEVPALHQRASAWFEHQGMPVEAVNHALAARDWATAKRLINAHAGRLTAEGRVATLAEWLERIPESQVAADPVLAIAAASTAATAGDLDRAERLTISAEEAVAAGAPVTVPIAPDVEIAAVRATICLMRRDLAGAARLARQAAQWERDPSRERYGIGHVLWASALLWQGRCGEARDAIDEVWAGVETVFIRVMAAGVLAVACFETGDLDRAERVARHAIGVAEEHHVGPSPEMTLVHIALGGVLTERADLGGAERHLDSGVELAALWRVPAQVAYGQMLRARLYMSQGQRKEAMRLVREAAPVVEGARHTGLLARTLHRTEQAMRSGGSRSGSGPVEALTDRELDVLRLLPSHLTQREIGGRLDVSLNTVKSYTQSLYRKLGVSSRTDAVDRARALHLL
jgi:LuxR family maltose regulon positive regulatory protein